MAELCRFYGIVIAVFFEKNAQHHRPHIHAFAAEYAASFALDDGSMIVGKMHPSGKKLIKAFIELRRDELQAAWDAAQAGTTPLKIPPPKVR